MYVPFEWFRTSGRARSRFDLSTINRFYDLLDHDTIYGVEGAVSPPPPPGSKCTAGRVLRFLLRGLGYSRKSGSLCLVEQWTKTVVFVARCRCNKTVHRREYPVKRTMK